MKVDTNIKFSQDQKEVFSIIKEVIQKYTPSTQAFLVGGSIRDMLIGLSAKDMDLMVYPIKAEDFSLLITKHLQIKDPHFIRANPEKSKNISTTKVFIPLLSGKTEEIDIAQARQDVYHDDSRIAETRAATPQEDALRRDFTINAIFYDIIKNEIVDYTGMGIKDLVSETVRTPLDPLKTFKDDPLRIFRAIRFSAKLGFKIDPQTYSAMKDPSLREIIKTKVSKDRQGEELKKMFQNPNAEVSVKMLKDTGLLDDIFSEALKGTKYEGKMSELEMNQDNPNHKLTLWGHTFQVLLQTLEKFPQYEGEKRIIMVLAALMHDLGKLYSESRQKKPGTDKYPDHAKGYTSYIGHEEESYEIAQHILKYLRLEPYMQQVAGLARYHMQPHHLVRDVSGDKSLRKFIRKMGELSLNWLDVLNIAIADAYSKDKDVDPETITEYQELEKRLQAAMASISSEATPTSKIKPILDGNEIMTVLNIKPGAHMKEMSEFVKELMDENPNITKEEAAQKLKDRFQNPNPTDIKAKASCSNHMIKQKMNDIQGLLDDDKVYEVTSVLSSLKENYGDDEKVARIIAINTLRAIIKDSKCKNNDLIQYVFDRAKENFFDSVLNAYAYGLLMTVKNSTDENVLKEVASRVFKMSPGTLRSVVEMIPKNLIVNQNAASMAQEYLGVKTS